MSIGPVTSQGVWRAALREPCELSKNFHRLVEGQRDPEVSIDFRELAHLHVPVQSVFTANDDFNWIGRSQISPDGSGSLPTSGGPPLVAVLLIGVSMVLLPPLVAGGFVVRRRQRK